MPRAPWSALVLLALAGCSRPSAEPAVVAGDPPPAEAVPDPQARYDEHFAKAVTDEIGPDQLLPPERTIADKSTGKLREEVERVWPTIQIADAGKPRTCVVTLDTELGPIELTLRPDLAPNH